MSIPRPTVGWAHFTLDDKEYTANDLTLKILTWTTEEEQDERV